MRQAFASDLIYSKLASLAAFATVVLINWGVSATSIVGYPPLTMMYYMPEWVLPAVSISIVLTLIFVLLAMVKGEANTWYKIGPMVFLLLFGLFAVWLVWFSPFSFSR